MEGFNYRDYETVFSGKRAGLGHRKAQPTAGRAPPDEKPLLDINSQEFRDWFKGSVLVGEPGNPVPFWHGTDQNFTSFDEALSARTHPADGDCSPGFFFSRSMHHAAQYGQNLLMVHLHMRRPYHVEDRRMSSNLSNELIHALKCKGFDGVIYDPIIGYVSEYVVFDPSQVRIRQRKCIGMAGRFAASDMFFNAKELP